MVNFHLNAAGILMLLIFIYSRQWMASVVEKATPPCAIYSCYKSEWTIEELFLVHVFVCEL